ncbi:MAG: endonuclease/exonuclease/phosphatase family protein [Frankia sp.]
MVVFAGIIAAFLALIAFGRIVHLDDALWPYAALNAVTPLLYLPAYGTAVVGLVTRRYWLVALSLVIVAAHLFWVVPDLWPGSVEQKPAGAVGMRLLTANLEEDNGRAGDLSLQIRTESPDIIVVEELSPLAFYSLQKSGAVAGYRYNAAFPSFGAFGAGVWSRFPLSDVGTPTVGGLLSLRMTVSPAPGRDFRLFAVHTLSPQSGSNASVWRTQLSDLRREAAAATLPVVMAGDFNATQDNRPFHRLTGAGLRDAHDVVGAGWTPSWSAKMPVLPPIFRLDHVLASRQFAVTRYHVGSRYGSDHLPLIVDLALRPSR